MRKKEAAFTASGFSPEKQKPQNFDAEILEFIKSKLSRCSVGKSTIHTNIDAASNGGLPAGYEENDWLVFLGRTLRAAHAESVIKYFSGDFSVLTIELISVFSAVIEKIYETHLLAQVAIEKNRLIIDELKAKQRERETIHTQLSEYHKNLEREIESPQEFALRVTQLISSSVLGGSVISTRTRATVKPKAFNPMELKKIEEVVVDRKEAPAPKDFLIEAIMKSLKKCRDSKTETLSQVNAAKTGTLPAKFKADKWRQWIMFLTNVLADTHKASTGLTGSSEANNLTIDLVDVLNDIAKQLQDKYQENAFKLAQQNELIAELQASNKKSAQALKDLRETVIKLESTKREREAMEELVENFGGSQLGSQLGSQFFKPVTKAEEVKRQNPVKDTVKMLKFWSPARLLMLMILEHAAGYYPLETLTQTAQGLAQGLAQSLQATDSAPVKKYSAALHSYLVATPETLVQTIQNLAESLDSIPISRVVSAAVVKYLAMLFRYLMAPLPVLAPAAELQPKFTPLIRGLYLEALEGKPQSPVVVMGMIRKESEPASGMLRSSSEGHWFAVHTKMTQLISTTVLEEKERLVKPLPGGFSDQEKAELNEKATCIYHMLSRPGGLLPLMNKSQKDIFYRDALDLSKELTSMVPRLRSFTQ